MLPSIPIQKRSSVFLKNGRTVLLLSIKMKKKRNSASENVPTQREKRRKKKRLRSLVPSMWNTLSTSEWMLILIRV